MVALSELQDLTVSIDDIGVSNAVGAHARRRAAPRGSLHRFGWHGNRCPSSDVSTAAHVRLGSRLRHLHLGRAQPLPHPRRDWAIGRACAEGGMSVD